MTAAPARKKSHPSWCPNTRPTLEVLDTQKLAAPKTTGCHSNRRPFLYSQSLTPRTYLFTISNNRPGRLQNFKFWKQNTKIGRARLQPLPQKLGTKLPCMQGCTVLLHNDAGHHVPWKGPLDAVQDHRSLHHSSNSFQSFAIKSFHNIPILDVHIYI